MNTASMSIVLHHYPFSPYSEKLRALLGYTGLAWHSVITQEMPPRPLLESLAGGYQRIPVVQLGADIFCDSNLVANELAELSNNPLLSHERSTLEIKAFIREVEATVVFAGIFSANGKALRRKAMASMSKLDLIRLLYDRFNLGRKASVSLPGAKASRKILEAHLDNLEDRLLVNNFLFGSELTLADFATYHPLWFVRDLGEKTFIQQYPRVNAWMDCIREYGHGKMFELAGDEALHIARDSEPRAIADVYKDSPLIGKIVNVAPTDYRQTVTQGELVGVTDYMWILRREDSMVGRLHVHFPRQDFKLA